MAITVGVAISSAINTSKRSVVEVATDAVVIDITPMTPQMSDDARRDAG